MTVSLEHEGGAPAYSVGRVVRAPEVQGQIEAWSARKWVKLIGALILVTLIWWPACWWRLSATPFYTKGEPREALVVWEMTHGGGWILPRRNGTEIPSKPPMFHWLGAVAAKVYGGVDEGTVRIPSALAALLGMYAVCAAGSLWWSVRAGLYAALVLATSFEWARAATNARVDMVLTLGLEVAFLSLTFFWCTRRRLWLLLFYPGVAWAVLAKGPVGVALPGLTALVLLGLTFQREALRHRRWNQVCEWAWLRQLSLLRGLSFVALTAGLWYVLALWQGGWEFFRKQVLAENVFTFLDSPNWGGGHRHGWLYLPVQLFLGSIPWCLAWPFLALTLWQRRGELHRYHPLLVLVVWASVVFLFYEFAASKRSVYLLALYPATALLSGWWWSEVATCSLSSQGRLRLLAQFFAIGVSFAFVLAAAVASAVALGVDPSAVASAAWAGKVSPVAVQVLRNFGGWEVVLLSMVCAGLWWSVARAVRSARTHLVFATLFAAMWATITTVRTCMLTAYANAVTLRPFVQAVRAQTGGAPVYFLGTFDYQAVYYFGGRIPFLPMGEIAHRPAFVLVEAGAWERSQAELGQIYEEVPLSRSENGVPPRFVLLKLRKQENRGV